jgi:hypothetical protein
MDESFKECLGMARIVAELCCWRCDFKKNWDVRTPKAQDNDGFDVEFVKKKEKHFMSREKDSDNLSIDSCNTGNPMYSKYIQDCFHSGVAMEQFQAIHTGAESVPPYFHWYQDFIQEKKSEHPFKRMNAEDLNGNLNWNSRVIVMDLLLLFAANDENVKNSKNTSKILKLLFPVQILSKDYPDLPAHSPLHVFFVLFWQPALQNFRRIFERKASLEDQNLAIGEVCHVLGITCRTQWMQIGFFHNFFCVGEQLKHQHIIDKGLTKKEKEKFSDHEYLPCRCERLLHLLRHPQYSNCRRKLVEDLAEVFSLLKTQYLHQEVEVEIIQDLNPNPPEKCQHCELRTKPVDDTDIPNSTCYICNASGGGQACKMDLSASYLIRDSNPKISTNTRHFKLPGSFFAHRLSNKTKTYEDPRAKTNVYLFALLDVS